jgi:peptide/nickel transport system permease protein
VISHAVPADPIVSNLGQQASQRPKIVQAFKQKWGLDKPLHVQYVAFLANLMRGELGTSINTRRAISKDLFGKLAGQHAAMHAGKLRR